MAVRKDIDLVNMRQRRVSGAEWRLRCFRWRRTACCSYTVARVLPSVDSCLLLVRLVPRVYLRVSMVVELTPLTAAHGSVRTVSALEPLRATRCTPWRAGNLSEPSTESTTCTRQQTHKVTTHNGALNAQMDSFMIIVTAESTG